MRAFLLLALALPLVAGGAVAQPDPMPTLVRCNSFYCFSVSDADDDGMPDTLVGGTSSFVHEAPSLTIAWHDGGFFTRLETPLGHEDDEDALVGIVYVGAARNGTHLQVVYADAAVEELTPGAERLVYVVVRADDTDGDGVPETASTNLLP
jgi:hypothetical protein